MNNIKSHYGTKCGISIARPQAFTVHLGFPEETLRRELYLKLDGRMNR